MHDLQPVEAGDGDKLECLVQDVEYRKQGYSLTLNWIDTSLAGPAFGAGRGAVSYVVMPSPTRRPCDRTCGPVPGCVNAPGSSVSA